MLCSIRFRAYILATDTDKMRRRQGINSAADADFDNTWNTLANAFTEIHTKNASKLSFEELYRAAYKLVLKKKGEELYNRVNNFEKDWLSQTVKAQIRALLSGSALPGEDESFGKSPQERRDAGERFLRGLKDAWVDHQTCMSMLTDVLMYMVSGKVLRSSGELG